MKIVHVLASALVVVCCLAAEPTWNPADAVKEAEQDIRTGHIKFYWAGSIASRPVGVPFEVAKIILRRTLELAVSPTTYHFENDRKNMPAGTTRRFTPTLLRSIDACRTPNCSLVLPNIALALPDDATLSRLLVGTWHGHRHDTEYRADGTWIMDPPDEGDNSRGKWRIEHGRLIETWRFRDESSDSTSVEEIIELTEKVFKSRIISQEGPGKPEGQVLPSEIFTVTRVTTKK